MAEDKNAFLLYADQIHIFEGLEDDEAGRLIKHLFRYVNDQDPIAPDKITAVAFASIKNSLKRDLASWEETKVLKSNGGKLGNLKRWHPETYKRLMAKEISIQEAFEVAGYRTTSDTDRIGSHTIGEIAVSVSDSVTGNNAGGSGSKDSGRKKNKNEQGPF